MESTLDASEWRIVEHPGQSGKARDALVERWNAAYGPAGWTLGWMWGDLLLDRRFTLQLYEDAYLSRLAGDLKTLDWLCTYQDVYDNAPSNVHSGIDYDIQENASNHYQHIALRRAMLRLGRSFAGDRLLEVRGPKSEGAVLNPGVVPFHLPRMIVPAELPDHSGWGEWWRGGSIEDFYQRNKVLLERR